MIALLFLLAQDKVDYYADVRPILTVHCYRCHSAEAQKGDFRLDRRPDALPALVPGKNGKILLLDLVLSADPDQRMPRKAPALAKKNIDVLRRWIEQGAEMPDRASHWAFTPPTRPALPAVKNAAWVRTPVDAFIAQGHENRSLAPAPEASRPTLIRRLSLDLLGLPPTLEEVDAFSTDGDYEKLVDRLLASPGYGERWGRHWLDLARFGETSGYEANALRTSAWRYRDYVVRAFNEDRPFDLFLRQQIAGDELSPLTDENLIATGFLAHGRLDNNQEDRAVQRADHLADITNAVGQVTLGLQVGCAQCHDHKWDPVTQEDYYRLMGTFVRGQVTPVLLKAPDEWKTYEEAIPKELQPAKDLLKLLQDGIRATLQKDGAKVSKEQIEKAASDDDRRLFKELEKKIAALEKKAPERPQTWAYFSPATSPHAIQTLPIQGQYGMPYDVEALKKSRPRLLQRGNPHLAAQELTAGPPAVFGPGSPQTSRSAFVDWLLSTSNPLTARVWANYVWQQHLGRGLTATPGDFGLRGAKPSHPELLDWLAVELRDSGWSTKHLHRLILLSATYRQASRPEPDDGFARWTPRRLEAEAIRDSLLAVAGELDPAMGGPSLEDGTGLRRSLYTAHKRHHLPAAQEIFDAPGAGESCARRYVSTVSLQPLYLMNNPFVFARAKAFAARAKDVSTSYRLAFGRPPSTAELEASNRFLAAAESPERGLLLLCHALLNSNEFAYLE